MSSSSFDGFAEKVVANKGLIIIGWAILFVPAFYLTYQFMSDPIYSLSFHMDEANEEITKLFPMYGMQVGMISIFLSLLASNGLADCVSCDSRGPPSRAV